MWKVVWLAYSTMYAVNTAGRSCKRTSSQFINETTIDAFDLKEEEMTGAWKLYKHFVFLASKSVNVCYMLSVV